MTTGLFNLKMKISMNKNLYEITSLVKKYENNKMFSSIKSSQLLKRNE